MSKAIKNKIPVIVIGFLLITNIAMLVLFFQLKNEPGKRNYTDRETYISNYLKNEVGFSESQALQYDSLGKKHKQEIRQLFETLSLTRKSILKDLAAESFSDSAINITAQKIAAQQNIFEKKMIEHLKDIRSICTDEQRERFDTGFYKIVGKRPHKNSK